MRMGLRSELVWDALWRQYWGPAVCILPRTLSPSETEPNLIQSSRMPTFFLNIREMITICLRFLESREQQDICMKASEGLELFSVNYGFPFNRYLFLNIYLIYTSIH